MKRPAVWAAAGIAVVLALLVVVLATRKPATDRVASSPLLGKAAPEVQGATIDGKSFDLADQRGRWVLVNFLASWCGPCQREHDDLIQFADAHAATNDVTVVSVVFQDDLTAVRQFFASRGGDWPVVRDDSGRVAVAWGVPQVPETYLVSPNGRVAVKFIGEVTYDGLERQLDRLRSGA